jgi:hypothetical protein
MTGLNPGTEYFVRAYATNSMGTAYGNEINFVTSATITVGDSYQGGIIGYIIQPGDPGYSEEQIHGLIVPPGDQSIIGVGIKWYNGHYTITGATGTALGTGSANTIKIVASQGEGEYAAKLCYDLVLGGYSDWYLPSIDELEKLYINRSVIGGFNGSSAYWSSSETDDRAASILSFSDGSKTSGSIKTNTYSARAIRSF